MEHTNQKKFALSIPFMDEKRGEQFVEGVVDVPEVNTGQVYSNLVSINLIEMMDDIKKMGN